MKFPPKSYPLRSGEEIVLRSAELEDAENLIAAVKGYFQTTKYFLLTTDEFDPTPESEREWINGFIENPDSLLLLAIYKGSIIGNIDLTASPRKKLQHTALIGMGISEEWRNKGLGTVLMKEAIDCATEKSKLEILWLQVFETNAAARSLYRNLGFTEEGRQHNFFKNADGSYTDNILMARPVLKTENITEPA